MDERMIQTPSSGETQEFIWCLILTVHYGYSPVFERKSVVHSIFTDSFPVQICINYDYYDYTLARLYIVTTLLAREQIETHPYFPWFCQYFTLMISDSQMNHSFESFGGFLWVFLGETNQIVQDLTHKVIDSQSQF